MPNAQLVFAAIVTWLPSSCALKSGHFEPKCREHWLTVQSWSSSQADVAGDLVMRLATTSLPTPWSRPGLDGACHKAGRVSCPHLAILTLTQWYCAVW
ncbi:hypothetical protein GGR56DRAFT_551844 [Xylariaceae sp. FL0804]|nr:hypothetical protein GGR56DRAFT_551844 [Xylariaceae sp. FL0804]